MLIRRPPEIASSEITPQALVLRRRQFLEAGAVAATGLVAGMSGCAPGDESEAHAAVSDPPALSGIVPGPKAFSTDETVTDRDKATSYNNFYEFGTGKEDPARHAHRLRTKPWSVAIDGEVEKLGSMPLEDLLRPHTLEERIYRLRCVEAWSMVIPWVGFPLGALIKRLKPNSRARYVAFETLHDPEQMPGQRRSVLDWPYVEALRMDEAMHPLTILAVGMYGSELPNQNGAPLRLIIPWKYGFKSIKSIVRITLEEREPPTTWSLSAPREYGFYANVNPEVDHPRWSQKRERRIGDLLKRPTIPFNGYGEQVASLYTGLDLRKHF